MSQRLKSLLEGRNGDLDEGGETDSWELPDSTQPDKPHARASNKPVYTFHCRLGAEGWRSFGYVQLDSDCSYRAEKEGQIIKLRFVGSKIWEVTISGLNLLKLYDLIMQHRMCWVSKADRAFAEPGGKEALITGIQIKEVEREP